MPSTSKNQQIAVAIALKAKKEGKKPKAGTASAQMVKMSQEELEKFARTKHKGLPKKKGKKKVNEAWGQKLDTYLEIIWRWFENQGYSEHEIEAILNDSENTDTIAGAEAHGINPVLVARDLKTENILSPEAATMHESFQPAVENEISEIFYNEYLPEKGFFINKFTNLSEFDLKDPDSEEKIIVDFSKYLEEEHHDEWDPGLEGTAYKQIVQEFLSNYIKESLNEFYSPITLDEFLYESQKS
jgi:hypothetical protein